jgi:hypothetical protein
MNDSETLWEEKNYTEQKKNFLNRQIIVQKSGINETNPKYVKNECENTGNKKIWKRNCPKCGKEIIYSHEGGLKYSIKNNTICRKCYYLNRKISWERICPKCKKNIKYKTSCGYYKSKNNNSICKNCQLSSQKMKPPFERSCPKCKIKIIYKTYTGKVSAEKRNVLCNSCYYKSIRKYQTPDKLVRNCPKCNKIIEYNRSKYLCNNRHNYLNAVKLNSWCYVCNGTFRNPMKGNKRLGKDNPNYGKIWNDEQRKIARINTINSLIKKGITGKSVNHNPTACKFIDKLNKERGWNLQHALNGGEAEIIGYRLDGYDKEKNIAFEYDEPRHNYPSRKQKDVERMNEIKNHLQCKFFRYDEKTKELKEII